MRLRALLLTMIGAIVVALVLLIAGHGDVRRLFTTAERGPNDSSEVVPAPALIAGKSFHPDNPFQHTGLGIKLVRVLDARELPPDDKGRWRRSWLVESDFEQPFLRIDYVLRRGPGGRGEELDHTETFIADQMLVAVKQGIDPAVAERRVKQAGFPETRVIEGSSSLVVKLDKHDLDALPLAQRRLQQLGDVVLAAEPDGVGSGGALPNDTSFSLQWDLNNTGQSGGISDADIDAPEAWAVLPALPAFTVAVIDSGIDYNHPDLAGVLWSNPGETAGNGVDDDGNGKIDDYRGWDFVNGDNDPMDDHNHGTHVSGTIAANRNNSRGVAGICPTAKIMALKVLNASNSGSTSNMLAAMSYARAKGVRLISMSLQNYPFNTGVSSEIDAGQTAGILYVICAGNQGVNNDTTPNYPSSYTQTCIIAVGNSDDDDARYSTSNYGATSVDIFAPGASIYNTVRVAGGSYSYFTGTSMATPHVTASAAIIWSLNPALTSAQVRDAILQSGDAKAAFSSICTTGKRLNLKSLVDYVAAEIAVEQPAGTNLVDAIGSQSFGAVAVGSSGVLTFTIKSVGVGTLSGLAVSAGGTHPADFVPSALSTTTLAGSTSTTFTVTFTPGAAGVRSAVIRIASNDLNENPFDINVLGAGVAAPAITTHPVAKKVNPGTAASFSVIATGGDPKTYKWQRYDAVAMMWSDINLATAPTCSIAHVAEADEGDYRVIVSNIAGSATSNAASLTVNNPVVIDAPLLAPIAKHVNDAVTFAVNVNASSTAPVTYQWTKNNVSIAGATAASYSIPAVAVVHGGDYRCVVKNIVGSVVAGPAKLTVVDGTNKTLILPVGAVATISASVGGVDAASTYLWHGGALPGDARFVSNKNILTIKTLTLGDAGTYACDVTTTGGMVTSGSTILTVIDDKPALASGVSAPLPMTPALVSETYFYSTWLQLDHAVNRTPGSYAATGLPPGLKCNSVTGDITGKPAVVLTADKTYNVTLVAKNARGTLSIPATMLVHPLPANLAGTYAGFIGRQAGLNNKLGGRFDMSVLGTGACSGKVTLGVGVYPFAGALDTSMGVPTAGSSITVIRKAPLTNLSLAFTIDPATHRLMSATLSDPSANSAPVTAWRNRWSSSTPASAYLGYFTFALDAPLPVDLAIPQGAGAGSFTISNATTAAVTVAGKLADGVAFTTGSFVGPLGEVLIYQASTTLDAVGGSLSISAGTLPLNADSNITGTNSMEWSRADQPNTSRVYEDGFGLASPVTLSAVGGRYIAPVSPGIVMGLTDDGSSNNAQLRFLEAELGDSAANPAPSPDIDFRVAKVAVLTLPKNTPAPPALVNLNPRSTTLAVNATTGAFSGRFTLIDPNPLVPVSNVTRYADYSGFIVKTGSTQTGYGWFLLAKRPSSTGQTILNTEMLSGQVVLEKK